MHQWYPTLSRSGPVAPSTSLCPPRRPKLSINKSLRLGVQRRLGLNADIDLRLPPEFDLAHFHVPRGPCPSAFALLGMLSSHANRTSRAVDERMAVNMAVTRHRRCNQNCTTRDRFESER